MKYIAGEPIKSVLKAGQIRCERFKNGAKLLCARSPHITMGNLYCVENARGGAIWNYFDLGENIVCVNAVGENIQQRLNGCDYDSDTMLVTDDALLVDYLYTAVKEVHFRKGREHRSDCIPISSNLAFDRNTASATEYRHKDKIVEIIDESKANINRLYMAIRTADEQEREVLFDRIADEKSRRDKEVSKWLTSKNVLMLLLRHYEKNSAADWRIYAALMVHPLFTKLVWNYFEKDNVKIVESKCGEYSLYGKRYAKKDRYRW